MADSLVFSVGSDTKNFTDGIGGMLASLAALTAAFLGAQSIAEAFGEAIDMGGRLNDLSVRTGETAGNLAVLERAFDNCGVSADRLGPAINKMQKELIEAASGSDSAIAAFAQLGLTWQDLENKSPSEQLALIGQRLAAIEDPSLRSATAMEIFGKSGGELLPVLTNLGLETEAAREQLGSLPEMLDESAYSVDQFGDNLTAIQNKGTEMAYGFTSEVTPALNAFTDSLTGVDAAAIGAGLADALVGAFVEPMKAAELLGDTLILAAKVMGNEMVYQVQYWGEIFANTFSIIGAESIPMLGNNMLGAFEMAAGGLGVALTTVIEAAIQSMEGVASALGLEEEWAASMATINSLQEDANQLMVDGAAKIAESSTTFESAFEQAKSNSTVVRQDFFGAEESSQKIADDFASLQQSAKDAMDEFLVDTSDMAAGRTTSGTDTILLDTITAQDAVNQTPALGTSGTTTTSSKEKSAAQQQAEINKQIGLVAGASSTQAIGQSASAQTVQEKQKELATLEARGKGDTAEADALRQSIDTHQEIALGLQETAADRDAANAFARENLNEDWASDMTYDDLVNMALDDIQNDKREEAGLPPSQKAKQAEQTKDAGKDKPVPQQSMQSLVSSLLQLLQKIEPKVPQHIMS